MNQTKKQKELVKMGENLAYIDIERGKIRKEVEHRLYNIGRYNSVLTAEQLEEINYWIEKDLKSLQKTLEYIKIM